MCGGGVGGGGGIQRWPTSGRVGRDRVLAERPKRRMAVRINRERIRGRRAVRGQERDRNQGPGMGWPGVRAYAQVPAGRAIHRVCGPAEVRAQVLAVAGAVPVLGVARPERLGCHTERDRHVPGPDRRAVGARQWVGRHRSTAQGICYRCQNRQGQYHITE